MARTLSLALGGLILFAVGGLYQRDRRPEPRDRVHGGGSGVADFVSLARAAAGQKTRLKSRTTTMLADKDPHPHQCLRVPGLGPEGSRRRAGDWDWHQGAARTWAGRDCRGDEGQRVARPGRGGFPDGAEVELHAEGKAAMAGRASLVINADESEPGSCKDREIPAP